MRKRWRIGLLGVGMAVLMAGCSRETQVTETSLQEEMIEEDEIETDVHKADKKEEVTENGEIADAVNIVLSDNQILVDGEAVSEDTESAVYIANDIVYYEEGKDFTYGEGTEADAHSKEEAGAHTVVHITKPGTYAVSGSLSSGQIAVDLGEDAEDDPEAVVTLMLNGVDINCSVAPGVIFYNVYECCEADEETASKDVDTSAAGANVVIVDGTENTVNGSYVARIYKSVELNEEGTEVVDSKKLHKYDAAFYSKMTMNVGGGEEGTGILNINAENEGLDSELHLTVNGGNINIVSGNDGINTNEDYISVTTVNDGTLKIQVNGETGEGDGIDSNGWLVINGGTVIAEACSFSGDAGIDSDMGIHINGGTVLATGNMLDHISESEQPFAVFTFAERQSEGATYTLKDEDGNEVVTVAPENEFTYMIMSDEDMAVGEYTLWKNDIQLVGAEDAGGRGGFGGGMRPEMSEDFEPGKMPEGMIPPEMPETFDPEKVPQGMQGGRPGGNRGGRGDRENVNAVEKSAIFTVKAGGSYFGQITEIE
ncbi:MAG: carbohydrate-binding domain-containing protein [Lachnospiraceae bacterium]|nr:carbohydrate-binding domain-containing protein [Lachnospiraceae bacterium]